MVDRDQTSVGRLIGFLKVDLIFTACILFIFISLGVYMSPATGDNTMAELRQWVAPVIGTGPLGILAFIIVNNLIKALFVIVSGVLLGIPSLLFIAINGITLGSMAGAVGAKAGYGIVAAGLLPHGVIELPAIVLATALGFSLGKEALFWILRRGDRLKAQFHDSLSLYLKLVLPALVVAALIEVFLTPLIVRMSAS